MAIPIKSPRDIDAIRRSGRQLWSILDDAVREARAGMTTGAIDARICAAIRNAGAEPVLLGGRRGDGPPFPACCSITVNEEVVHGVPGARILRAGDVVTIDAALRLDGWCADAARATVIGVAPDASTAGLVRAAREALDAAIGAMTPGVAWSVAARAAARAARAAGVRLVSAYAGHGIGRRLHEPPEACFLGPGSGRGWASGQDFILRPGMVLAVEPIVTEGLGGGSSDPELIGTDDGWTVLARDRSRACHEERTVAVTRGGPVVLTAP
ncbi:MAG: type I methionyl aminopeptidase [Phycisphaerales bacterium]